MNQPVIGPAKGIIRKLLDISVDNELLSDIEMAKLIPETTAGYIRAIRNSDSFRRLLAKAVEQKYGDTIRAVRQKGLETTIVAMDTLQEVMTDPATLPGVKMEASKIALNSFHQTQDRETPKAGIGKDDEKPGVNVQINLSAGELAEARNAMVSHGKTIQLEGSDVAHTPSSRHALLGPVKKIGDPV